MEEIILDRRSVFWTNIDIAYMINERTEQQRARLLSGQIRTFSFHFITQQHILQEGKEHSLSLSFLLSKDCSAQLNEHVQSMLVSQGDDRGSFLSVFVPHQTKAVDVTTRFTLSITEEVTGGCFKFLGAIVWPE